MNFLKKSATQQPLSPLSLDREGLLRLVQSDDVTAVRRYFDQSLHGGNIVRPEWAHLSAALSNNNLSMMRLLVTWGAQPDSAAIAKMDTDSLRRLRLAGLNLQEPDTTLPSTPSSTAPDVTNATAVTSAPTVKDTSIFIPKEWTAVLKAFQKVAKAPEAMIVGGSLRDRHLNRPVSDVDIFLKMPFMPGMEQGTMKRAFKEAGLTLHKQTVRIERGTRRIAYREERIFHQSGNISNSVYRDIGLGVTSAWRVVAGPNNTPYNIVFIDSPMMERLRKLAKAEPSNDTLIYEFIQKLDIGLCQIAFRGGKSVYASPYYDTDRRNKTLTLVNPNAGKHNHLARVAKKYKDFTPDREMRKILSKHNTEPRQRPAPRAPYMFLPPG